MKVSATFELERFEQDDAFDDQPVCPLARAHVQKRYAGEIQGSGRVEMLTGRSAEGGAGYVALERLEVSIADRKGSFVLLHAGTMNGEGHDSWARWPIVPGSGAGELQGIRGEGQISRDAEGQHHFELDYEL